jgi:hypothetical protein
MQPVREILYRSQALEVRRIIAGDGRRVVVTFDSYHEPAGTDRPGFGEAFFQAEDITAIHVMSDCNDWFQHTEIKDALLIIKEACLGAERILAYGSSMGGYAALRFAGAIGAHAALALSPQYSLDPRKVPFETRWASDRRRIRFLPWIDGPIQPGPSRIFAYDSALAADRCHAELLTAAAPMTAITLPHAGHPVGGFLNDIKLLRPLVLTALDGSFDPQRFRNAAHKRRTRSAHWLAHLADRQPVRRFALGVALAQRASEMAPDHPALHDVLARRLAVAGDYAGAIAAHKRAIAIEPIVDYRWGLSKTLHQAGQLTDALKVAEEIQQLTPSTAGYYAWSARLREEIGDVIGALADLRIASRNDPNNLGYRVGVFRLMARNAYARLGRALRAR